MQQPAATIPTQTAPPFGFPGQAVTNAPVPAQPAQDQTAHFASAVNAPTTEQINQAAQQGYYPVYNPDGSFNCWTTPKHEIPPPQFQQPMQMQQQQMAPAQAVPQVQLPPVQQFPQFQQPVTQTPEQFAQQHQQVTEQFPGPPPILPPQTMPTPPQAAPAPAQNAFNQYGQPMAANTQQTQFPPVPGVGQIMNNPAAQAQIDALKAQLAAAESGQVQQPGQPQRRNLVTGAG